jgi:7,8-dihydro-6-hydroxymethylpterin dimethyltransferase
MTVVPPRERVDHDEVVLEHTKSICPVCKAVVDAEVNARDDKVFLRKRCRNHGTFEALLYDEAQMFMDSQRSNKPGTLPLRAQTEVRDGCPLDCGLCPDHKQHACLGIVEATAAWNLDCPVCFADSRCQPDGFSLTFEQVEAGLDAFVAAEGARGGHVLRREEPVLDLLLHLNRLDAALALRTTLSRKDRWAPLANAGEHFASEEADLLLPVLLPRRGRVRDHVQDVDARIQHAAE